ncbi:MAG: YraN family protein [Magnetococcales bacterium]|nr:YraN family protein [Magnetococcales bacterium]
MNDNRKALGSQAEQVAEQYLLRQGYRILERNVRLPQGELDLVALHGETLVFCEVKARQGSGALDPALSIHTRKQERLIRLATAYLQRHPGYANHLCRFDAVLVWKSGLLWQIKIIADAFRPGW